jgi:ADP-ribosylglycohydrolase
MDEQALGRLAEMGLLPPQWNTARGSVGWAEGIDYADRYRGALLGGGIGDALGRPVETRSAAEVARRFGRVTDFYPWSGWVSGPKGTITDDTQLTILVAESLLEHGEVDPSDLGRRLIQWLPYGRGKGLATTAAVLRLTSGMSWCEAGEPSDGNGAAMRVAPVGMAFATDPDRLRRAAALSAVVTHVGPMAVAGAVAQALAVARLLLTPEGRLDPVEFADALGSAIEDLYDPGAPERRPGTAGTLVRLASRIREIGGLLSLSPPQAFDRLYNGAFVLESLPAALWCFLRSPDDPEEVIITAASGGRDADTVAAMAGTLAGAYQGETHLPERWLADLEFASELRGLADGLSLLAQAPTSVRRHTVASHRSEAQTVETPTLRGRFTGCLLGGAVGDALGAAVEFDTWSEIRSRMGPAGIREYAPAYGRTGAVTDDTQMTLFTAEGLIRAHNRMVDRGLVSVEHVLHRAYERWLLTQVRDPSAVPWDPEFGDSSGSSWLFAESFLQHRRAPGNTCIRSLKRPHRLGTPEEPLNDSKGCGGVMRAAPAGLLLDDDAFDRGCRAAALTHGHPNGWLAAGSLAEMILRIVQGLSLKEAVGAALNRCQKHRLGSEVAAAIEGALTLSHRVPDPRPSHVESLGAGWIAEEALAIGVFCALTADDFRDGIVNSVNHSGDSDSTGSITGNLLGALLGESAIDPDLLDGLEGEKVIRQVGLDLYETFASHGEPDWQRYPPW